MSRLLSAIGENTATLHFCPGSGSPRGRERTAFSARRISGVIPTRIICNAQLPFYYILLFYHWGLTVPRPCGGLGGARLRSLFLSLKAPKSYLTTWAPGLGDSVVCGGRVEERGWITSLWITWMFHMYVVRKIWWRFEHNLKINCCNVFWSNQIF